MLTNKVFSLLLLSFFTVMTTGCGGGVSSQTTTVSPSGTGTASVYWNPVSTYTDTTLINNTGVPTGYRIRYGTVSGHYSTTVTITIGQLTNPNSPRYTLNGLSRGVKYYFAVSAYDSSNIDSALSAEVSKTIN